MSHNPGSWSGRVVRQQFLFLTAILLAGALFAPRPAAGQCLDLELQELLASDGMASDRFGSAVAVSATEILIGAHQAAARGPGAGAAYFYASGALGWSERQKVTASDGAPQDWFGWSAAMDDSVAVVGALGDDDMGANAGSAYVFRFDGSQWNEEQRLLASDGQPVDSFGYRVAVCGDVIVVSAFLCDDLGKDSGAAYVYRHDGVQWQEEQKLLASDGGALHGFGRAVAIDGDLIVIGSGPPFRDGVAYVYRYDGLRWIEVKKLTPGGATVEQSYASAVAVSDQAILVGSPDHDSAARDGGGAYLYTPLGNGWILDAVLVASDASVDLRMGSAVALDGDLAVAAAPVPAAFGEGVAYVFHDSGPKWVEVQKLQGGDSVSPEAMGQALDLHQNVLIAGASTHVHGGVPGGSAYVFPIPALGLDTNLDQAQAGNTLLFNACGGLTSQAACLFTVDVDGTPFFVKIAPGWFDTQGVALFGGIVPPGLAGTDVQFIAFGQYLAGRLGASNHATVTFF